MKIKNITKDTNHAQEIVIPILIRGGEGINLTLKPGDFVFVEELNNNMTVRVYQQKQFLDITFDEKSNNYDFYKVYEKESGEVIFTDEQKKELITKSKIVLDDISSILTEEEIFVVEKEINNEIEVEIIVPENSIINKGGRPKGVKNKPKKGKPKSKSKARKRKPATRKK
jgi:hypothetical protein